MESFEIAARAYAGLVRRIRPDQWAGPGLGDWDLRALVGHTSRSLVTVDTYLDQPAAEVELADPAAYFAAIAQGDVRVDPAQVVARGRQAGEALGSDPAATVDGLVARVLPRALAAGDPLIRTVAGGMRLRSYLPTRTFELVVHSFDIAAAAGVAPPTFAAEVLSEVAGVAAAAAVRIGRGPELILALTGRASLPPGFSVV
jgi:uncharacterized protein (TIGR03083 family)